MPLSALHAGVETSTGVFLVSFSYFKTPSGVGHEVSLFNRLPRPRLGDAV